MKYLSIKQLIAISAILAASGVMTSCSAPTASNSSAAYPSAPASASKGGENISESAVFSNLGELDYTPSSLAAYKISPNDLLEINVFRVAELSGKTRVDENGRISLPLVGTMVVAGLTQQQLEKKLADQLSRTYLNNPQVSVFVQEQTSKEITVGGAVKRAGVFPIKSSTTVSQAIALAGGPTDLADPSRLVLFRPKSNGGFKAYNLDLKAIREGKQRDPYLTGKDQVILHESGSRVWLNRVLGVTRGVLRPFSL